MAARGQTEPARVPLSRGFENGPEPRSRPVRPWIGSGQSRQNSRSYRSVSASSRNRRHRPSPGRSGSDSRNSGSKSLRRLLGDASRSGSSAGGVGFVSVRAGRGDCIQTRQAQADSPVVAEQVALGMQFVADVGFRLEAGPEKVHVDEAVTFCTQGHVWGRLQFRVGQPFRIASPNRCGNMRQRPTLRQATLLNSRPPGPMRTRAVESGRRCSRTGRLQPAGP